MGWGGRLERMEWGGNYYGESTFTRKVIYYENWNGFREKMANECEAHSQLLQELRDLCFVGIVAGSHHNLLAYGRVSSDVH